MTENTAKSTLAISLASRVFPRPRSLRTQLSSGRVTAFSLSKGRSKERQRESAVAGAISGLHSAHKANCFFGSGSVEGMGKIRPNDKHAQQHIRFTCTGAGRLATEPADRSAVIKGKALIRAPVPAGLSFAGPVVTSCFTYRTVWERGNCHVRPRRIVRLSFPEAIC